MSVNTKVNGQLVPSAGLYSVTKPIGMADIYSTEEKEVGLWIDNKPLYQRTLTINTIASTVGVQRFAHNIANIETAFAISGTWLQKSDDSVYIGTKDIIRTDGNGNINVGKGSVGVWVDATNIIIDTTENRSSQYLIVTIQYTKTTDTPWSGKFVPQGYGYVSSGDIYSEQERQVGVWTDGKPLYQKTVDCGALPNNTTKTVAHGISDVDRIVELKGTAYSTTNGYTLPLEDIDGGAGINSAIRLYANVTNIYLDTKKDQSTYNKTLVTIQYTKTTDVAGSGEYVPSGDKAVHYSTDEEVIGTFMGETLYRKVFTFSTPITCPSQQWAQTDILTSSINAASVIRAFTALGQSVYVCDVSCDTNETYVALLNLRNIAITVDTLILEYTKASS